MTLGIERRVTLQPLAGQKGTVSLPPEWQGPAREVTVAFGVRKVSARVATGDFGLSADLSEELGVPTGLDCRLRSETAALRLGPSVGILGADTVGQLTPDRLRALSNHLLTMGGKGGLFLALARDGIDPEEGLVSGYRFVSSPRESWVSGRFPLPQVIFRRYGARLGGLYEPLRNLGVHVFNERLFHKGEAWDWMAADPRLRPHLPETVPVKDAGSVESMLQRYPAVYIKPVWGSLASGVLRVRRLDDGRGFELAAAGREPVACPDLLEMRSRLTPLLPRPGIVQQGLTLAEAGDRLVDFRVILQKDGSGSWTVPGIVGRCGTERLHVSNMATGGFPTAVDDVLGLLFGSHPHVLFRRKEELARLALAVGEAVDRSGLLIGDLGLDLAYDLNGHPWIIEANNRDPDHNIAWEAANWPKFYRIRTLPLEFACHLAGFGAGQGGEPA